MLGLVILGGTAFIMVGTGFWMVKRGYGPRNAKAATAVTMLFAFLAIAFSVTAAFAQETGTAAASASNGAAGLGFIGAALSTGLACVGAGIAVAFVGAAALGVVGEKPSLFGTTLIYMGLAEGIAIYGLVISLFILGRI